MVLFGMTKKMLQKHTKLRLYIQSAQRLMSFSGPEKQWQFET